MQSNLRRCSFLFLPIFFTLFVFVSTYQTCNRTTNLTPQELINLSNFTSAVYLPSDQEQNLRTAYQSLNRTLNNYFIEIDPSYQVYINDIEECQNFPNYLTFNSMDDVWICMQKPVMVLECNKEWELKIGCGTFIELHKPFDSDVISEIRLTPSTMNSLKFSINLGNICSGSYHLWFVYSVRAGKIIKNVKPIFVSYPACPC